MKEIERIKNAKYVIHKQLKEYSEALKETSGKDMLMEMLVLNTIDGLMYAEKLIEAREKELLRNEQGKEGTMTCKKHSANGGTKN